MQSFTFCISACQITYLGTIKEINIVKSIADTKKTICNVMETNADEFQMLIVDGASLVHLDFVFMEEWTTFDVLGVTRNKDVKIKVTLSATPNNPVGDYDSLRGVFDTLCTVLGLNTPPAVPPSIEST